MNTISWIGFLLAIKTVHDDSVNHVVRANGASIRSAIQWIVSGKYEADGKFSCTQGELFFFNFNAFKKI